MNKLFWLCIAFAACTVQAFGQQIPALFRTGAGVTLGIPQQPYMGSYRAIVDSIFGNLNLSSVTSHTLVDFSPGPNYWKYGPVRHDSNLTRTFDYRQLYVGLWWSATRLETRIPNFETLDANFYRSTGPVRLSALAWRYHYLDTSAVANNLISIQTGVMRDVPGRTASPYKTRMLYAAGCSRDSVTGLTQQLLFSSAQFYTNASLSIQSAVLQVAGEVNQTFSLNTPFSVTFASAGRKRLVLRLTFTNGTVVETHAQLGVAALPDLPQSTNSTGNVPPYVNSASLTYSLNLTADRAYTGSPASAKVTIRLACGNTTLRKPIIFIEGFDPPSLQTALDRENYDFNRFIQELHFYNIDELLQLNPSGFELSRELNDAGYDLVFIDFANGADYIQNNAYLVQKVIQVINQQKVGYEKLFVIGASMGGLVGRYAIRDMEVAGVPHNVGTYVTYDTPHQGANVPLAIQGLVNGLHSHFAEKFGFQSMIIGVQEALYSPAAKQMAIVQFGQKKTYTHYYYNPIFQQWMHKNFYYVEEVDPSIRQNFLNELTSLGYPQQCIYANIASGSIEGIPQNLSPNGALARLHLGWWDILRTGLYYFFNSSVGEVLTASTHLPNPFSSIANVAIGFASFAIAGVAIGSFVDIDLNAMPDASMGVRDVAYFDLQIRFLWIRLTGLYFRYTTASQISLDQLPGGVLNIPSYFSTSTWNSLPGFLPYGDFFINTESFCFLPTFSSLDVKLRPNVSSINPYDNLTDPSILQNKYVLPASFTAGSLSSTPVFLPGYKGNLVQRNEEHVRISQSSTSLLRQLAILSLDRGLNQVATLLNRGYNFGVGYIGTTQTPTSSRITQSLTVGNGGVLGVHADDYVGFSDATPRLGYPDASRYPKFEVTVSSLSGCVSGGNTVVDVQSGGRVELGVTDDAIDGILRITRGQKLILRGGSTLYISGGSRLIIDCGAQLELHPGYSIVRENSSAEIIFNDQPSRSLVLVSGATFSVPVTTEMSISGPATTSISRNGDIYEVQGYGDADEFVWSVPVNPNAIVLESADKPWRIRVRDNCADPSTTAAIEVMVSKRNAQGSTTVNCLPIRRTISLASCTCLGSVATSISGPSPVNKFTRFCIDQACTQIGTNTNTHTYSIPAVTGAAYYNWTVTNGVIVSGQGTRTVGVQVDDPSLGTMTLSVAVNNGCMASDLVRSRTITVRLWNDITTCPGFRVCPNGGGGSGARSMSATSSTSDPLSSAITIASPNPAGTSTRIETLLIGSPDLPLRYTLVNSRTGSVALRGTVTDWSFNLNVASVPRGVYTLQLTNGLASHSIRVSIFP